MPDGHLLFQIYRWLLKLYPAGFRDAYTDPMEQEFRDELAASRGAWAVAVLCLGIVADLVVTVPAQVSRELVQDSRHTLRLWANRPWHTAFGVSALALGIGANTGGFSVLNALLLRSLPFHDPGRLALLRPDEFLPPHGTSEEFHQWRMHSEYAADAALVEEFEANLGDVRDPGRVHVAQTSWNFLSTLGITPVLGRSFVAGEDTAGHDSIVILSYGLWQRLFAGDPRVLGSRIRLDGRSLTIVGVAPRAFDYPGGAALWKPATLSPGNNGWMTVVRLKPGLSWPQARAAFNTEVDRFAPSHQRSGGSVFHPQLTSLQDALVGPVRKASLMLMAGSMLILLVACMNLANLLMTRTADRALELSVRSALGASQARLMQQLFTECLLLSLIAMLAGLLVAVWITGIAASMQPPPLTTQSYSILDGHVLIFAIVLAVLSSTAFGVLPALYAGRVHAFGSRGSNDLAGSRRTREMLAGVQVMLTVVLLAASVSVGRAFVQLIGTDRGFEVSSIVTLGVSLDGTTHDFENRRLPFFEEALATVRRLPGVQHASATEFLPLYANAFVGGRFGLDGRPAARGATMIPVLSEYFATMGGRILSGREFTDAEVRLGAKVAVVNDRFAREFGTPKEVVGRQLTVGRGESRTIVGVVQAMAYETDPSLANGNQVFVPSQTPGGFFSTIVVRVNGRAKDSLAAIRDTIRSVDPRVPVFSVKTMEERLAELYARPKFYRTVIWMFAAFAGLLAMMGVYGTVSYAVVQRTRETGVRLALGASARRVRIVLLCQNLRVVAAGAISGVLTATLLGRFLESMVEGAKALDPATSIVVVLSLTSIAAVSIWRATDRITGLDVAAILRSE